MGYNTQEEFDCPNCQQLAHWEILRVISLFTFFFIPLFPYRVQYFMLCPHCEAGMKLKGAEAKAILAGSGAAQEGTAMPQANLDRASDEADYPVPIVREEPFVLPTAQIVQAEKRILRKGNAIFAGIAVFLFLFGLFGSRQEGVVLPLGIACMLVLLVWLPLQLLQFRRRKGSLPEEILIRNGDLWIDNQCINLYHIKAVKVTSMKVKSNSFFPVQRYLLIQTDSEKRRYWLGSNGSFPDSQYAGLCRMLETALQGRGAVLTYSMRKSLMT